MNPRLETALVAQGGVCTAAQARACELTESELAGAVRHGVLVRIRRDAYVAGSRWSVATPEGRLALRATALMLGRPGSAACRQAALALHGLPLWGVDLERVDLAVDTPRVRRRGGLRLHPADPDHEVVRVNGARCLGVATALAQVALDDGVVAGLVPFDAALRTGLCTTEKVAAALERVTGSPRGRRTGSQLLALADPACESPGETRTRVLLHDLGLDYESQVEIRDEQGRLVGRVDFLVAGRVVVEFDGMTKYEGADGRSALAAEKRREDALRRLGYAVVRLVWSDLADPQRVVELVGRALLASSGPGSAGRAGKP